LFLNAFLAQCGSQLHALELTVLERSHMAAAGSLALQTQYDVGCVHIQELNTKQQQNNSCW